MDIYLTKGDTGTGFRATLEYDRNQEDLNEHLKEADVRFVFGEHEIIPQREDDNKFLIVFEKVHTEKPGIYHAAFKVKYKDSRIETFPDARQPSIKVKVTEG